ncbi:fungal-specific transcription factor domain-containing protein [Microdochium trichocladiopsis]|uniref:Fungal-specific transcription factor domain-containing protein n=1 Tax=Microdochium trichocladiopsis TaxID=1682393 RepID=A0A9P8Y564_9PEZI|nr:fungal-specific transcription factor domain-containing protein [Microdochium trichocladiopsis]KAH7029777.1 fungal-specific transcription factor domain-containing protein [Microdochium trichocladiopsis]
MAIASSLMVDMELPAASEDESFDCTLCGMGFLRQDHLTRHLALHNGQRPFTCAVCHRQFSRGDTLERHQITHGATPSDHRASKPNGQPRASRACASCRRSKERCDGQEPCSRCRRHDKSCHFLPRRTRQTSKFKQLGSSTFSTTTTDGSHTAFQIRGNRPTSPEQPSLLVTEPRTVHNSDHTESLVAMGSNFINADISFDIGHSDLDQDWHDVCHFPRPGAAADGYMPAMLSLGSQRTSSSVDAAAIPVMAGLNSAGSLQPQWSPVPANSGILEAELENFCHVESVSPEGYDDLNLWARMVDTTWVRRSGSPESSDSLVLPPAATLTAFIQLYFEKFHETMPIIHRPTFNPNTAPSLLVLAVANIGRRFSRLAETSSQVVGLENWVYNAVKRHTKIFETSESIPLWLAQAVLLSHMATSFSDDRTAVERSHMTRGVLDVVLRKLEQSRTAAEVRLLDVAEGPDDEQGLWAAWTHYEAIRRTAYGLWLFDSQCCLLFDLTPAVPTEALDIPLPCHEKLWEKSSAASWELQWTGSTKQLPTLREELQSFYDCKPVGGHIGACSFMIILFGFFRDLLVLRQIESHGLLGVINMHGKHVTRRETCSSSLWKLLDPSKRAGGSWNRANAVTAQFYHIIRVVQEVCLKDLLAFTGWRVARSTQAETSQRLRTWVSENGECARKVVLHAGTIFQQCWSRSTEGYQEPSAILIASIALWVYNSSLPYCSWVAASPTQLQTSRTIHRHDEALDSASTLLATSTSLPSIRAESPQTELTAQPRSVTVCLHSGGDDHDDDYAQDWVRSGRQIRPMVVSVGDINAPGAYLNAVRNSVVFLEAHREWKISQLFASVQKDLLTAFESNHALSTR